MQLKIREYNKVDMQGNWLKELNNSMQNATQSEFVIKRIDGELHSLTVYILTQWD